MRYLLVFAFLLGCESDQYDAEKIVRPVTPVDDPLLSFCDVYNEDDPVSKYLSKENWCWSRTIDVLDYAEEPLPESVSKNGIWKKDIHDYCAYYGGEVPTLEDYQKSRWRIIPLNIGDCAIFVDDKPMYAKEFCKTMSENKDCDELDVDPSMCGPVSVKASCVIRWEDRFSDKEATSTNYYGQDISFKPIDEQED